MTKYTLNKLLSTLTIFTVISYCCVLSAYAQDNPQISIAAGAKSTSFAPGVISTVAGDEWAPSFTPGRQTVYFTRNPGTIYFSKFVDGKWTTPKVANFSGQWKDMDPFISPDGKHLFYSTYRPLNNDLQDKPQKFAHIWYVDQISEDIWSAPHHLDAPVNLDGISNYSPSVSSSGTLCFSSPQRDTLNKKKSYAAKWLGDHYDQPKMLSLNGSSNMGDPSISPDESYMLFKSNNDIYISFRYGEQWGEGKKLGSQVNQGDANSAPYISPDAKMLYYSSANVKGILMIPVQVIPVKQ